MLCRDSSVQTFQEQSRGILRCCLSADTPAAVHFEQLRQSIIACRFSLGAILLAVDYVVSHISVSLCPSAVGSVLSREDTGHSSGKSRRNAGALRTREVAGCGGKTVHPASNCPPAARPCISAVRSRFPTRQPSRSHRSQVAK